MHIAISDRLALWIATGGYAGYARLAPGTVGSLIGLMFYVSMAAIPVPFQVALIVALFGVGVWAADRSEKIMQAVDPRQIVVDEIVGMWIAVLFLPLRISYLVSAFLLFRLLDIAKPFPARQAERLRGGWGIMADDVVVALYTNAVLQGIKTLPRFFSGG